MPNFCVSVLGRACAQPLEEAVSVLQISFIKYIPYSAN